MQVSAAVGAVASLLAVDLGLKSGLAAFDGDGRLSWYRSQHFASKEQLRRAAWTIVSQLDDLAFVVVEGDARLGEVWAKAAAKRGARCLVVTPEAWRRRLLLSREQRSGTLAKRHAEDLARAVIEWSGAKRPTSLRHDVAEAIAIGLWGVLEVGWLEEVPAVLRRG